ncbi:MAG TPA: GDSL-type esterase/lipase family protein [Lacunisphaera sp.]|jgi:lysophospholipase L1-like esterase
MKTSHRPFIPSLVCVLRLVALAGLVFAGHAIAQPPAAANRFEKNVQAYEAADKLNAPPQGAILLVGDSQFFRWKTVQEDLKGYTVVNRGIDSFQSSDLLYFTERLVFPYRPRLIVIHVGGNDVHNGKSPARVLADFKAFVEKVRAVLPEVPIAFTSITPSPGRWHEAAARKAANQAVRDFIATQKNLHFIDLWDAMLTPDGKPREDIWVEDRVHPNHAGYLIRVNIMRPLLGAPDEKR